jgi:hypothetical protein
MHYELATGWLTRCAKMMRSVLLRAWITERKTRICTLGWMLAVG